MEGGGGTKSLLSVWRGGGGQKSFQPLFSPFTNHNDHSLNTDDTEKGLLMLFEKHFQLAFLTMTNIRHQFLVAFNSR